MLARIAIIDCCEARFSKIISDWPSDPIVGKRVSLEVSGQTWDTDVINVLPQKSYANPFELDAVFMKSQDENLFLRLCDCIGDGWFEAEGACEVLSSR